MLVRIEDLNKGDVVILSVGSMLIEAQLLRQPKRSTTGKLLTWQNKPKWVSVLCAVRVESEIVYYGTHPNTKSFTRTVTVVANGKEYNSEKRINFTDRDCWLIKKHVP
jgi:hypothetical protein